MKKNIINLKYLILLYIILLCCLISTYSHHGQLLIDCGREVYYPTQIIKGQILYKDLFNIYGPFSYMFNAFLFKCFGVNLNVLYFAGYFCAFAIISSLYMIAKRFLNEFIAFSISIFAISVGVLNLNLFNFVFPYSYAMLYGFTAFLISLFLLLKYSENSDKIIYLYLSSLLAGLSLANKYEFIAYFLAIIFAVLKIKKLNLKEYIYTILSLSFFPVACFSILFLQGLEFNNLISTVIIVKKMALSQSLRYFYSVQGVYFNKNTIPVMIITFLKFLMIMSFLILSLKVRYKFLSCLLFLSVLFFGLISTGPAAFNFLPVATLILSIISYKKIINNTPLILLILSSFLVSLKTFWGLATLNYGLFFICPLLIAFLALIAIYFDDKNINRNLIGVYVLLIAFVLGYQNILIYQPKHYLVKTDRGQIYIDKNLSMATNELINFIQKNTKKNDKIVIFPEGTFVNFLTDRKSDNYYNSLIPLYFEVLGEKKFINHFKKNMPEYIVFNNINMSKDYYFENICNDYAFEFCEFVEKNYCYRKEIDVGFRYLIFQKR